MTFSFSPQYFFQLFHFLLLHSFICSNVTRILHSLPIGDGLSNWTDFAGSVRFGSSFQLIERPCLGVARIARQSWADLLIIVFHFLVSDKVQPFCAGTRTFAWINEWCWGWWIYVTKKKWTVLCATWCGQYEQKKRRLLCRRGKFCWSVVMSCSRMAVF